MATNRKKVYANKKIGQRFDFQKDTNAMITRKGSIYAIDIGHSKWL